jgi:hypothetical protein
MRMVSARARLGSLLTSTTSISCRSGRCARHSAFNPARLRPRHAMVCTLADIAFRRPPEPYAGCAFFFRPPIRRTKAAKAVQTAGSESPASEDSADVTLSSSARAAAAIPVNSKIAAVPLNRCARLRKSCNIGVGISSANSKAALRAAKCSRSLCIRTQKASRIASKLSSDGSGLAVRVWYLVALIFCPRAGGCRHHVGVRTAAAVTRLPPRHLLAYRPRSAARSKCSIFDTFSNSCAASTAVTPTLAVKLTGPA